jgi:hypothetical protein
MLQKRNFRRFFEFQSKLAYFIKYANPKGVSGEILASQAFDAT